MPSDIFIKTASGWAAGLAKKIFIKTASSTWSAAKSVWLFFDAGWTRVWPLSGVYVTRNPFISTTSSSSELSSSTVLRVGTTYRGNRGSWNPNGYTISSYQYKWVSYTYQDPGDQSTNYDPSMSTLSGTTNDFLITGTNYDRGWIVFFVTAKASGGTPYDGSAESFRYYVARQNPRLASGGSPVFNIVSPKVGDTISYSSGWDISDAYRPDAARSTIKWYSSELNNLTESQLKSLIPVQSSGYSYVVKPSDSEKYIYAMEEVFNSGTDLSSLINGVTAIVQTSSLVGTAPSSFTYSLTNVGTVTTPSAPVQQRVSTTSNTVLIEMSSAFPSDTESYELWTYGSGSAAGGTLANPAVQFITTLNQYFSNGDIAYNGTFDTVTNISSSASNSPISTISRAIGSSRVLQFNVSTTTGAQSWRINYTISGASGGNGTYTLDTNSMPRQTIIGGVSNPTVTINSIIAYSGLDQTGSTTTGTAGFPTSLSSIPKPSAFSSTSTSNYTFYTNLQVTGSQRRITLPSAFTSGTTIYVSTNGYINWGGDDPVGSVSIPSLSTSGITVAPLAGDLRQGAVSSSGTTSTGGLWYFADSTNYWVTWWGNYYQDASQVARYQVKFYWGQSYADVYIVNNSLTTLTPSTTAVQNGANQYQNFSSTTAQTSTLLSTASMNRISTQDGVDDNRTAILAIASQPPSGGTATVTPETGTAGSTTYTASTSGWSGSPTISYSYAWQGLNKFGFYWETFSTATTFVPTVAQNSNSLAWQLVVTASNGISPNGVATKAFTVNAPVTPITPTISMSANTGVGQTTGTINWTSTNQSTWSSTGTFSGSGTTEKTLAKTGLTAGTIYTGTVTVTSSTGHTASANYSLTTTSSVSIPSGGSVSLSGNSTPGSVITASTSGWSNSPTSYDVYITTALSPNIPTSSSSRVASSVGGSSTTYTITPNDAVSPVNIFRAFATASNSAGTSNPVVQSSNTISASSGSPATAPGTPGTPTNGWTGGTSYPFSWTAPGAGTVTGGGAATITNYSMIIYEASSAAGTGAVAKTPFNIGSGSSSYTYTSPNASLYYAASVAAINSAGIQGPYSGISVYK